MGHFGFEALQLLMLIGLFIVYEVFEFINFSSISFDFIPVFVSDRLELDVEFHDFVGFGLIELSQSLVFLFESIDHMGIGRFEVVDFHLSQGFDLLFLVADKGFLKLFQLWFLVCQLHLVLLEFIDFHFCLNVTCEEVIGQFVYFGISHAHLIFQSFDFVFVLQGGNLWLFLELSFYLINCVLMLDFLIWNLQLFDVLPMFYLFLQGFDLAHEFFSQGFGFHGLVFILLVFFMDDFLQLWVLELHQFDGLGMVG